MIGVLLTQSKTLTNTNDDTSSDKDSNVATRRKRLHECGHDDESSTNSHTDATSRKVSKRASHEKSGDDSSDGVRSVDSSDDVWARVVEVRNPMFRILERIEHRRIVAVQNHT